MKKIIYMLTVMAILLGMAACAARSEPATDPGAAEDELLTIAALEEPASLNVGHLSGAPHALPTYIAQEKGWFDAVNLEVETTIFASGPVMVEAAAANAWDCGVAGAGGAIPGVVMHGCYVLGTSQEDVGAMYLWARKDSDIVAAGQGNASNAEYSEIYGSAESWKGKEILLPAGTSLQYALICTLEQFGLTLADITLTSMEVSSANTAFKVGEGDILGTWSTLSFGKDKEEYVAVSNGKMCGAEMVTSILANPNAYDEKYDAIKKWLEVYEHTVQWIIDNPETATEYMVQMCEEEGAETAYEDCYNLIFCNDYYTLEDNYDSFITDTADGTMTLAESTVYKACEFFVSVGSYTQENLNTLLDGYFKGEMITELYQEKHGK